MRRCCSGFYESVFIRRGLQSAAVARCELVETPRGAGGASGGSIVHPSDLLPSTQGTVVSSGTSHCWGSKKSPQPLSGETVTKRPCWGFPVSQG